jgi:hypothetical protein
MSDELKQPGSEQGICVQCDDGLIETDNNGPIVFCPFCRLGRMRKQSADTNAEVDELEAQLTRHDERGA